MIRIGIAGIPHVVKGKGTVAGIIYLHKIGLNAMEVQFGRNVYMTAENASECADVSRRDDVALSVHAPYYVNLASKSEQTREKSKDWIVRSARIAATLGASVVAVHAAREEEPDVVVESLREIVRGLKKEGVSVPLGLETMGDVGEFGSVGDVLEVVRKVPGTDIVLDFAHIHARTCGGLRTVADFEAVLDQVSTVKKDDYHVHFSGIEHKAGREVRHVPVGDDPSLAFFARALAKRRCNATVICESPLLEEDALLIKKAFELARKR